MAAILSQLQCLSFKTQNKTPFQLFLIVNLRLLAYTQITLFPLATKCNLSSLIMNNDQPMECCHQITQFCSGLNGNIPIYK